jgi:hypothetical protein
VYQPLFIVVFSRVVMALCHDSVASMPLTLQSTPQQFQQHATLWGFARTHSLPSRAARSRSDDQGAHAGNAEARGDGSEDDPDGGAPPGSGVARATFPKIRVPNVERVGARRWSHQALTSSGPIGMSVTLYMNWRKKISNTVTQPCWSEKWSGGDSNP